MQPTAHALAGVQYWPVGHMSCFGVQATQSPEATSQSGLALSGQSPGPVQPGAPPVLLLPLVELLTVPPAPPPLEADAVDGAPPEPP